MLKYIEWTEEVTSITFVTSQVETGNKRLIKSTEEIDLTLKYTQIS